MKTKVLFFAICLLSSTSLVSQSLTYEAFLKGKKVGEMKVVKEVSDNKTSITATTHIKAHMIFTIRVDVDTKATYMDNVLIESEAVSKQNGHIHSSVQMHQSQGGYVINVDGDESKLQEENIVGADFLYFEEPKAINSTIALASGEYLTIEKGTDGEYFFVHDGKRESHHYASGVLEKVIIEHSLYTVVMKLKK